MPKVSRKKPRPVKAWSATDVRTLKKLAGKEPRARIARTLKRTAAAVTFKAFKLRLSLRVRSARKKTPR
jgi:hypothetical protein